MSGIGFNNDVGVWGKVARLLSKQNSVGEQSPVLSRFGQYGELAMELISGKSSKLADEGSYYQTRTPTVGTGVASITTPTAYVATSPYIIVTNNNPLNGGKNIWLDYIKLNLITPGTSSTNLQYTTALDTIARYSSGGSGGAGTNMASILQGPLPTNTGAPTNSAALIYAGALVAVAASPQGRVMQNGYLRTAIAVANDQYVFNFGSTDTPVDTVLVSGTAIVQRNIPHVPVCIAPGGSFLFHLFGSSMAAATTCEVEVGHVER